MSKTATFFKLKNFDKLILIKALFLLWIIRIMLWIHPFQTLQKILTRFSSTNKNESPKTTMKKLIWAINVMSIYTPNATCLTKALAAQLLLARHHYSSNIKIGVSKNESGFEAHAWLVSDDNIILGESEKEYIPILNMDGKTR